MTVWYWVDRLREAAPSIVPLDGSTNTLCAVLSTFLTQRIRLVYVDPLGTVIVIEAEAEALPNTTATVGSIV